jgi:hypothetical protein
MAKKYKPTPTNASLLQGVWKYLFLLVLIVNLSFRFEFAGVFTETISTDSWFYDESARNMATGKGFVMESDGLVLPITHQAPGYSAFMALIYRFTEHQEPLTKTAPRVEGVIIAQTVMSLLTAWLWARMVWASVKKRGLAWLVFTSVIFYFPLIHFSVMILPETFNLFVVSLILYWLWHVGYPKPREFIGLGLLVASLILTKPYFAYIPLVMLIWFHAVQNVPLRKLFWFVLALSGPLLWWTYRNYSITEQLIPIQRGYEFVVTTSECPETLCKPGSLWHKEEPVILEESSPKSQAVVIERVWWHTIAKQREFFGIPAGMLLRYLDSPITLQTQVFNLSMWVYFVSVLGLLGLPFTNRPFSKRTSLLFGMLLGASVMHGYVWSLPRYAHALLPIMLVLGFKGWYQLLKQLHQVNWKSWWWIPTLGLILGLISLGSVTFATGASAYLTHLSLATWIILLGYYLKAVWRRFSWPHKWYVAGLVVWVWLMTIAITPLLLDTGLHRFAWENQPFPLVMRVGDVILK